MQETDGLEKKKQQLQSEIQQLQTDREELEFILENHRACCRLQQEQQQQIIRNSNARAATTSPLDIKPYTFPVLGDKIRIKTEHTDDSLVSSDMDDDIFSQPLPAKRIMLNQMAPTLAKPSRPSSLNVATAFVPTQQKNGLITEVAGIPISTPSTGMGFNFDSLMDGGTGLTPVSAPLVPSCSSQQRNLPPADLSSPDAGGSRKLVSL